MKYRLKDKELQRKLDDISGGDFSKALSSDRLESVCSPLDPLIEWRVCFGESPDFLANRFSAIFLHDEIEETPEYNAGGWNHWPETEPEECVLMEIKLDGDDDHHGFNFFLNGIWYHSMGCTCIGLSSEKFSYRPAKLFFEEERINKKD